MRFFPEFVGNMNLAAGVLLGSLLHLMFTSIPCYAAPGVFHSDSVPDAGDAQSMSSESSNLEHPDSDTASAVRNTPSIVGSGQRGSALLRHEHASSNPSTLRPYLGTFASHQTGSVPWSYEYGDSYIPSVMRNIPGHLASGQAGGAPWSYEYGGSYIPRAMWNPPSLFASGHTVSLPWSYEYGGSQMPSFIRNTPGFLTSGHTGSAPWSYEYSHGYIPNVVRNVPSALLSGHTGRAPWTSEHGANYHPSAVQYDPYNYGLVHGGGAPSNYGGIPSEASYAFSPTYNQEGEYAYHTKCLTHGRYSYTVKPNANSREPGAKSSSGYPDSDYMERTSRNQGVAGSFEPSSVGGVFSNPQHEASSLKPISSLQDSLIQSGLGSYHSSGAGTSSHLEGAQMGNDPSGYLQDGYEPQVNSSPDTAKTVPKYPGDF